jgi:predicted nucleic acid-binding protein
VHHSDALGFVQKLRDRKLPYTFVFTSDYVFDETVTLVRLAHSHEKAVKFGDALPASRVLNLLKLDDGLIRQGWTVFKQHHNKTFSFTDCTSFALMKQMEDPDAFSFDCNFDQAGFRTVP